MLRNVCATHPTPFVAHCVGNRERGLGFSGIEVGWWANGEGLTLDRDIGTACTKQIAKRGPESPPNLFDAATISSPIPYKEDF